MSVHSKTEDLEAFIAVVDSGSFSSAARLLDQQVAKVSRAVARLEKANRCPLLSRTTRRLELTEEGQLFIVHAREGLNAIERGEESLKLLQQTPSGRLRIDAASPFVLHQITPWIGAFRQAFPGIQLDLTSNDGIVDLLERRTDLAIRIGELKDSNLHARKLGSSQLRLVASPRYISKSPTLEQASDLEIHQLIGFSNAQNLNAWPLKEPVKLQFGLSASSGETIRQLCIEAQGIALLSNFMCRKDIDEGRLVEVLPGIIASPNSRESVQAVYYRNSAISSRIVAFLDFMTSRLTL